MIKRAFIRALWGVSKGELSDELAKTYNQKRVASAISGLSRVKIDISRLSYKSVEGPEFITYTFGKSNVDFLNGLNIESRLITEDHLPYPTKIWWHKIDVLKYAMEEDGFDEIVFLDWDCVLNKPLFDDVWERLGQKEDFQACLMKYSYHVLDYRKGRQANKLVPNGGFVYIRNKSIPAEIEKWSRVDPNQWLDEAAYAKYLDDRTDGWIGTSSYWDLFEPEVCTYFRSVYRKREKDYCFRHRKQSENI